MHRNHKISVAKAIAAAAAIPILLYAYAEGPDPRLTGAPGEGTCAACHGSGSATASPTNIQIAFDGGNTYTPGVAKRVTLTISDSSARRWGFEASARQTSDNGQAGTIRSLDANTRVVTAGGVQYISHTTAGTRQGATSSVDFVFEWTPPASAVGEVTFYVAANAANGNNQADPGDRIYTNNAKLTPAAGGGARPTISESGVVNGASFRPNIAANAWVTIRGADLAGTTRIWEGRDFDGNKLPTSLDGVSVRIAGKAAYVYYISPTQLNVLAATDIGEGPVQVEVTRDGQTSNSMTGQAARVAPGFFKFDPEDRKYIAATHVNGAFLGKTTLYPGLTTPAAKGETIVLYGTGFGPTEPAAPNGETVSTPGMVTGVTVTIGNVPATVSFAGLTGSGLYQLNVVVPASAPSGDAEVIATVGGVSTPGGDLITIQ
jgi:uncharacterized protein (TIGR03437 family)